MSSRSNFENYLTRRPSEHFFGVLLKLFIFVFVVKFKTLTMVGMHHKRHRRRCRIPKRLRRQRSKRREPDSLENQAKTELKN